MEGKFIFPNGLEENICCGEHISGPLSFSMAQEYADKLYYKDVQELYDNRDIYEENDKKWLKQCVLCLGIINPFEVGYHLQCCKTAFVHETCRLGPRRNVRHQTVGQVNRKAGTKSSHRRLLISKNGTCPMCRKPNSILVKFTDHLQYMALVNVKCPIANCEKNMSSAEFLQHYAKCAERTRLGCADNWRRAVEDGRSTDANRDDSDDLEDKLMRLIHLTRKENFLNLEEGVDAQEEQHDWRLLDDMQVVNVTHEWSGEDGETSNSEDEFDIETELIVSATSNLQHVHRQISSETPTLQRVPPETLRQIAALPENRDLGDIMAFFRGPRHTRFLLSTDK